MQLDKFQEQQYDTINNGMSSASGALSSLQADYNSADMEADSANSVIQSVASNPFDPNGPTAKDSARAVIRQDQQHMAHDSAVAPQYQGAYQQWSEQSETFTNSVNSNGVNIGAVLAGSKSNNTTLDHYNPINTRKNNGGLHFM